jgi:uncharacterized protein
MTQYPKPLPSVTALNAPFWRGLKERELRLQHCDGCTRVWYPPAPQCPHCWSDKYHWARLSGRGRVNSWVVFHQAYFKSFEGEVPYNVAEVELEEGPRLLTNLVDVRNEEIRAGMPVEIVFDEATEEITLAKFKPAAS